MYRKHNHRAPPVKTTTMVYPEKNWVRKTLMVTNRVLTFFIRSLVRLLLPSTCQNVHTYVDISVQWMEMSLSECEQMNIH